jgi:hypothetical protein
LVPFVLQAACHQWPAHVVIPSFWRRLCWEQQPGRLPALNPKPCKDTRSIVISSPLFQLSQLHALESFPISEWLKHLQRVIKPSPAPIAFVTSPPGTKRFLGTSWVRETPSGASPSGCCSIHTCRTCIPWRAWLSFAFPSFCPGCSICRLIHVMRAMQPLL